jgi:hypothetical protein
LVVREHDESLSAFSAELKLRDGAGLAVSP